MRVLEEGGGGGKKGRRFCSGKIRRDWAFYTMHHYPPHTLLQITPIVQPRGEMGMGTECRAG